MRCSSPQGLPVVALNIIIIIIIMLESMLELSEKYRNEDKY